jgi:hypothetical protein
VCQSLNLLATEYKPVVDLFAALLTPVIAIGVAYIAWRQYKVEHASYELSLYNRKSEIYRSLHQFLQTPESGKIRDFGLIAGARLEALFLFDAEFKKWVDNIAVNAMDDNSLRQKIYLEASPHTLHPEYSKLESGGSFFREALNGLSDAFVKHMKIR